LVGRPKWKRPLGRPRHRWKDNIKLDVMEIGIDGASWIQLAQDRFKWRVFVNTVMNLRGSIKKAGCFFEKLSDISNNILHHEVSE
jgi:hypothetical protein